MQQKKCPNCEHLNLASAVYCFECGQYLSDSALLPGIKPHSQDVLADDTEAPAANTDPRTIETVAEIRKTREKGSLYNAGLTCLRCGTLNTPQTTVCVGCGAQLISTDEVHQLRILASARSSVGRVRSNNEDTVGLWARHGAVLGLVADGMGGAAAGEEASRLAKEAIQADFMGAVRGSETLHELSESEAGTKLRTAIDHANHALLNRIRDDISLQGMGTTSTLALARGKHLLIAHIGDSRAYIVDGENGWIHQITDDHSFVEALLAAGHITQAQAARHPMRSVLYRALGQSEAMGGADLYARDLKIGDRIILCSDGLPRHVANQEICQIALQSDDPEVITQTLIDLTLSRGAEDNVSIVTLLLVKDTEPITPETLKPLLSEKVDSFSPFKTGPIGDDILEQARAEIAKIQEQEAKAGSDELQDD